MDRLFYKEIKLSGTPIETKFINVQFFNHIFYLTNVNSRELHDFNPSTADILKLAPPLFKNVQLIRDFFRYHNEEHGSFFLPSAIVFYDVLDYNFPTEFFFIVKVVNEVELRSCQAGEGVEWFQIPELHKAVTDPEIILKVENTILEVMRLAAEIYRKKTELEEKVEELKTEAKAKKKAEAKRTYLNDTQKKAYQELTELCVYKNSSKVKILKRIEKLKNYDDDEEYYTTLNYFMEFLEEKDLNFIMRMDWKAEIEDLEWLLKKNLKDNYDVKPNLPKPENYDENASVSSDGVFQDYDQSLRENGLQLGFIDTQSDEYIVILHKVEDKEKIETAVNQIGYEYSEK
ncbi:hypothetical protein [uncultured Cytophaga sp.]|uniref:DUF6630 family protein n=1 Tax=uncultured Cytophaga sp. TaxID=160238 RepID=UPI0026233F7D|nr:hypothetical protein [uncultured Cytophaga sp.]